VDRSVRCGSGVGGVRGPRAHSPAVRGVGYRRDLDQLAAAEPELLALKAKRLRRCRESLPGRLGHACVQVKWHPADVVRCFRDPYKNQEGNAMTSETRNGQTMQKKQYSEPHLRVYGDIREITQTSNVSNTNDGGSQSPHKTA